MNRVSQAPSVGDTTVMKTMCRRAAFLLASSFHTSCREMFDCLEAYQNNGGGNSSVVRWSSETALQYMHCIVLHGSVDKWTELRRVLNQGGESGESSNNGSTTNNQGNHMLYQAIRVCDDVDVLCSLLMVHQTNVEPSDDEKEVEKKKEGHGGAKTSVTDPIVSLKDPIVLQVVKELCTKQRQEESKRSKNDDWWLTETLLGWQMCNNTGHDNNNEGNHKNTQERKNRLKVMLRSELRQKLAACGVGLMMSYHNQQWTSTPVHDSVASVVESLECVRKIVVASNHHHHHHHNNNKINSLVHWMLVKWLPPAVVAMVDEENLVNQTCVSLLLEVNPRVYGQLYLLLEELIVPGAGGFNHGVVLKDCYVQLLIAMHVVNYVRNVVPIGGGSQRRRHGCPEWIGLWLGTMSTAAVAFDKDAFLRNRFVVFLLSSKQTSNSNNINNNNSNNILNNNNNNRMALSHYGLLAALASLLLSLGVNEMRSTSCGNTDTPPTVAADTVVETIVGTLELVRVLALTLSNQLMEATISLLNTAADASIVTSFARECGTSAKALHEMLEAAVVSSTESSGVGRGNRAKDQVIASLCDVCLRSMPIDVGGEVIPNNANVLVIGRSLKRIQRSKMAVRCMNELIACDD